MFVSEGGPGVRTVTPLPYKKCRAYYVSYAFCLRPIPPMYEQPWQTEKALLIKRGKPSYINVMELRQLNIGGRFDVGMKLNSKVSISTKDWLVGNHIRTVRETSGDNFLEK